MILEGLNKEPKRRTRFLVKGRGGASLYRYLWKKLGKLLAGSQGLEENASRVDA